MNVKKNRSLWAYNNSKINFVINVQASDVRMIQGAPAEKILEESRQVLETNGEWELADIKTGYVSLSLDDRDYSEIIYHVSTFNYSMITYFDF